MATPKHAFCRLNSGLAGYYLFGGTPTVVDPRSSNTPDTALTNTHEQSHRDLINNTVYGYTLRRLRDLQEFRKENPQVPDIDHLLDNLSGRAFQCAEGAATAMEILASDQRPAANRQAIIDGLPSDYKAALFLFLPIALIVLPFPGPIQFFLRAALVQAVQEAAADWSLFIAMQAPGEDLWAYANFFQSAAPPDENLLAVLAIASQFTIEMFTRVLDANKHLASDLTQLARGLTQALKIELVTRRTLSSGNVPPAALDEQRLELFRRLEAQLTKTEPGIRPVVWQSGKIFGPVVEVETKEPDFLLAEENIAPSGLLDRVRALATGDGFSNFVVQYFRDPRKSGYSVIVNWLTLRDASLDMGQPYLISEGATKAQLLEVDQSGLPLEWLTWGVQILKDGGFYDWELAAALQSPVFVRLHQFSWEKAELANRLFSGATQVLMYEIQGLQGISAAALRRGKVTVFNLVPERNLPDVDLEQEVEHRDISADLAFSSAVLVAIRTSKEQTIG